MFQSVKHCTWKPKQFIFNFHFLVKKSTYIHLLFFFFTTRKSFLNIKDNLLHVGSLSFKPSLAIQSFFADAATDALQNAFLKLRSMQVRWFYKKREKRLEKWNPLHLANLVYETEKKYHKYLKRLGGAFLTGWFPIRWNWSGASSWTIPTRNFFW